MLRRWILDILNQKGEDILSMIYSIELAQTQLPYKKDFCLEGLVQNSFEWKNREHCLMMY